MLKRTAIVLVAIALTALVSGCAEQAGNTSAASASPQADTITATPPTSTLRPGPSMLFSMDNVTRYQYFVNVPMKDYTRHQKLEVAYDNTTYSFSNSSGRYDIPVKRTTIEMTWLNEENGYRITYDERLKDGRLIRFHLGPGTVKGQPFSGVGVVNLSGDVPYRGYLDVSTRFNSDTDGTMKIAGYDTAKYIGEPYNCTIYEVVADEDTFQVWKNGSFPLPPKIVAIYKEPNKYADHPDHANVTGPLTYELTGWD